MQRKTSESHQLQLLELLISASREGHREAVLYLLDNGANPFLQTASKFDGESALIAASKNGHADVVALCCYHVHSCASSRALGLSATDNLGFTCVQWATRMQHVGCLSIFLHIQPELMMDLERFANVSETPSTILTSPEFRSFLTMHYPQHAGILRAPSRLSYSTTTKKAATLPTFDSFIKEWCCSCASWYRLENSLVVYAPYACFTSLLIGLFFSIVFAMHREMWHPQPRMVFLHLLNFGSQGLLWRLITVANKTGAGCVDSGTSYDQVLRKVVDAARAGVVEAAVAAETASTQRGPVGSSPSACCHICRIWKKPHEGHSPVTYRCIPDYDHFCVYLGHDIGRDNYPTFFYALGLMGVVALPTFLALAVLYVQYGLLAQSSESTLALIWRGSFNVFFGWSILSEVQMLAFFLFHVYATSVGLTSREVSKLKKKTKGTHEVADRGKRGFFGNWTSRMNPPNSKAHAAAVKSNV